MTEYIHYIVQIKYLELKNFDILNIETSAICKRFKKNTKTKKSFLNC